MDEIHKIGLVYVNILILKVQLNNRLRSFMILN